MTDLLIRMLISEAAPSRCHEAKDSAITRIAFAYGSGTQLHSCAILRAAFLRRSITLFGGDIGGGQITAWLGSVTLSGIPDTWS